MRTVRASNGLGFDGCHAVVGGEGCAEQAKCRVRSNTLNQTTVQAEDVACHIQVSRDAPERLCGANGARDTWHTWACQERSGFQRRSLPLLLQLSASSSVEEAWRRRGEQGLLQLEVLASSAGSSPTQMACCRGLGCTAHTKPALAGSSGSASVPPRRAHAASAACAPTRASTASQVRMPAAQPAQYRAASSGLHCSQYSK